MHLKRKGIPVLVIGGGGYTLRNVPRCWTYETSLLTGVEVPNEMPPENEFYEYFCPEYKLHMSISNMENLNTNAELEETTTFLLDTLKSIDGPATGSVSLSHYEKGGAPPVHMDLDVKKDQEIREEAKQDESQDHD